jgi:5-methylcytosine-specific restriction enzyme subunit McrC
MTATSVCIREYARLCTTPCTESLDQAQVSQSAFDFLVKLNATFSRNGASLTVLEDARHLRLDNYVGVIETPCGTRIEILPKHSDGHDAAGKSRLLLKRMIAAALDLPVREAGVAALESFRVPLPEWVMGQFLAALDHVVQRGIRFDYVRLEEEQRFLRGRLDVTRQLRQMPGRQHLFQIRHDVFLPDRAENRLLKSAAMRVLASTRSPDNWRLANELCVRLGDVPESRDIRADFRLWRGDRNLAHYRSAKPWCQLILGDSMPLAIVGETRGMSLLFPMERLFESYVAAWMRKRLAPEAKLITQARTFSLCEHDGARMFQLRPDLLVQHQGSSWVMDTKWKRIDGSGRADKYGLAQSDFYQMFAYGHTYLAGAGELVLIYPHWSGFQTPLPPFVMPRPDRYGETSQSMHLWVLPFNLEDANEGLVTTGEMTCESLFCVADTVE